MKEEFWQQAERSNRHLGIALYLSLRSGLIVEGAQKRMKTEDLFIWVASDESSRFLLNATVVLQGINLLILTLCDEEIWKSQKEMCVRRKE